MNRSKLARRFSAVGAIACAAAVIALGAFFMSDAGSPGTPPEGAQPLDRTASLADDQGAARASIAAYYDDDSIAEFADIMHIEDGAGNALALSDVPDGAYTGFLFEVADSAAAGLQGFLADAVGQGLISQVHGNLYAAESLDTVAALFGADQLSFVEPDFNLYLIGDLDAAGGTAANPAPDYPPTDPRYTDGSLWNLDMLNVGDAWELGLDGDPYVYNGKPLHDGAVRVAVIDTGMYGTGDGEPKHEDFDYDRVEVGYDFIHETDKTAADAKGHGTFVVGLIAAQPGNGVGVAGAMPGVTIVSEKVFDTSSASTSDVVAAIYHAVDEDDADVINMSLGGEYNESSLQAACDYAVAQGVLVVASAGNDGVSTPNYPAAYDSVVGVASVDSAKNRSTWSQYGKSVFVTAPGENVTSTYIEGADSYYTGSGTSFSGPEVAALAAMCKSVYPDIAQDDFKQFLIETSTDLGTAGYDDYYGWGLVDFGRMAAAVLESQVLPWYNVAFVATDSNGAAVKLDSAADITLTAAEDISWEADPDNGVNTAGTWEAGTIMHPEADGTYKLHRGTYAYTIVKNGYYTLTGTLKTYAANQTARVALPLAREVTASVVDSDNAVVAGASLSITSPAGRVETPKNGDAVPAKFDLASGVYAYEAQAEGYVVSRGMFNVGLYDKSISIALYKEAELADVAFAFVNADDETKLVSGTVDVVVSDESGNVIAPQEDGGYKLARGKTYAIGASKVGYEPATASYTVPDAASGTCTVALTRATAAITFNVVDSSGHAIATAQVKVANEDGVQADPAEANPLRFHLNEGRYSYLVTAPGYEEAQGSVQVGVDSRTLTIVLQAVPQVVAFEVVEASDHATPIAGASVKVSAAGTWRSLPANADGTFTLPAGDYSYTVYKEGYDVAQGGFTVGGEALTLHVELAVASSASGGFAGGTGTADDPYLIATEDQLRYLARQTDIVRMTNTSASTNKQEVVEGYYKLVNDIQLTGGDWLPIGNAEFSSNYVAFGGTFDGDGHTVSGMHIDSPYANQGFFGYVRGATIRNLVVQGDVYSCGPNSSSGGTYIGGLVGSAYYANDPIYTSHDVPATRIYNCGSEVNVTGRYAVGGIIGSAQGSIPSSGSFSDFLDQDAYGVYVEGCYNTGAIRAMYEGEYVHSSGAVGGIAGSGQMLSVVNCYNTGSVDGGYMVGGIIGSANGAQVVTSYNAGHVAQHYEASGYSGNTGTVAGRARILLVGDTVALERDDNGSNALIGFNYGSSSAARNSAVLAYADMYRTDSLVERMNTNTTTTNLVSTAFVKGRDFPLLSWQVAPGQLLASMPHIVVQPQGVAEEDAYKQGAAANALTARVEAVTDGTLTWQWYASESNDASAAEPVEGASGTGADASYVPPTSEKGVRYYFVKFTNTVSIDMQSDVAMATSDAAAVYVRSAIDAQAPSIVKLNPNNTNDVNTSLIVSQGADQELSVTAMVDDGGKLSYQWYKAPAYGEDGAAIGGATGATYDVDTASVGTSYYYVVVINRLEPGNVAQTRSDWISVEVKPYTISSYDELCAFRDAVNGGIDFYGQVVTLATDIRIPDGVDWTPIGTMAHPFRGTFMGGAGYEGSASITVHTVSNLRIDGTRHEDSYVGLFGVVYYGSIYDVWVEGKVTGASNTGAGLLAGAVYVGSSNAGVIANCGTAPGSSVEGKYAVGGLVGLSYAEIVDCANHADVLARAYKATDDDNAYSSNNFYAVGGVVGYSAGGSLLGCYNTGTVTVDEPTEQAPTCALHVGGVAGTTSYSSGLASCYNAGALAIGKEAVTQYDKGVLRVGSVAGNVVYDYAFNTYYLEGTYTRGTNSSDGDDVAEVHGKAFMKTAYFTDLLNTGSKYYGYKSFRTSENGMPYLVWEDPQVNATDDTAISSAEPYIRDLVSAEFPDLKYDLVASYFQNIPAEPVYVVADSPDGGTLTYEWKKRAAGAGESAWVVAASGTVGEDGRAPITFDVSETGVFEYQCWITNARADANAAPLTEQACIPIITVTVKDATDVISLRTPGQPNSAENPWEVRTAGQLRFLADVVNRAETFTQVGDPTFAGQYVELVGDIDLLSLDGEWVPIGNSASTLSSGGMFCGTFEGAGHVVSNVRITAQSAPAGSDQQMLGLFGQLRGATVRDLEVQGTIDLDSAAAWSNGGVIGYAYGSQIENVVNRVDVTGAVKTGGIVGYAGSTAIIDCENLGVVKMNESIISTKYGGYDLGGICGYMFIGSASTPSGHAQGIYNCFNNGTVAGGLYDGAYRLGAICSTNISTAYAKNNFYRAGSAVCMTDDGAETGGFGSGTVDSAADDALMCVAISDVNSPETAWLLATSGGDAANSGRWGNFQRFDAGDAGPTVHLTVGRPARAIYRVDGAAAAALFDLSVAGVKAGDATVAYAEAGQEVTVDWLAKAGFTVKEVGWKLAAEDSGSGYPEVVGKGDSFAMPAGDVVFEVTYEQDERYRYELSSAVTYDGAAAPAGAVEVDLASMGSAGAGAYAGETVSVALSVADGYQLKSVEAEGSYGTPVTVSRGADALHYTFTMPAENVAVAVTLEDVGAPADEQAASEAVTTTATHLRSDNPDAKTSDLLYSVVAFSGSYYGQEHPEMTYELEYASKPGLYQQTYSLTDDGELHTFTGIDLGKLVLQVARSTSSTAAAPANDTEVLIECADGSQFICTYGDLTALTYNAYDHATGQPTGRGLPVMLFFGVDGAATTGDMGPVGIVFGERASNGGVKAASSLKAQGAGAQAIASQNGDVSALPDDGSSVVLSHVVRIAVGDDVNYSQHVYYPYNNMDLICGGTANTVYGYSDLTVRVYRGSGNDAELVRERVISLVQIESLARADTANIQRGYYSTVLYEDGTAATTEEYNDYYEGYDLYSVLRKVGVPYNADATVQFYQTGLNGLDRSRKTIDVSLDYVAGGGVGDYSGCTMTYVSNSSGIAYGSGTLTGVHPMIGYGKNGLPLVWSSGSTGVNGYNYRGPLVAFLPQNAEKGGAHLSTQTATSCYLGLIDVYYPADADIPDTSEELPDNPGGDQGGDSGNTGGDQGGDSGNTGGDNTGGGSGSGSGDSSGDSGADGKKVYASTSWVRLWGDTALDTMREIVGEGFDSADAVVIATNDGYWDALAASALAGKVGGPVLLTDPNELSPQAASEIRRLGASICYIAGGKAALSENVEKQLKALGLEVVRLWGENAQLTAVKIADEVGDARSDTCVVTTSGTFQDALSASPYAYANKAPIYLTDGEGNLSASTLAAIGRGGYAHAVIAGGELAVSPDTEQLLESVGIGDITRLWGETAYETSGALAAWAIEAGMGTDGMGVATCTGYWDALTGAALCGKNDAVLVLVDDANASNVDKVVKPNARYTGTGYVFGGTAAVSDGVLSTCVTATKRASTLVAAAL